MSTINDNTERCCSSWSSARVFMSSTLTATKTSLHRYDCHHTVRRQRRGSAAGALCPLFVLATSCVGVGDRRPLSQCFCCCCPSSPPPSQLGSGREGPGLTSAKGASPSSLILYSIINNSSLCC